MSQPTSPITTTSKNPLYHTPQSIHPPQTNINPEPGGLPPISLLTAQRVSSESLSESESEKEKKTNQLFDGVRRGLSGFSSFSKKMAKKTLSKMIHTESKECLQSLSYKEEAIRHLFACITTPREFKACRLTCKSWLAASSSISIHTHTGIFARESSPSSITIQSYQKKVSELEMLFPEFSVVRIETALRCAIKHEHRDIFYGLAECFATGNGKFAYTAQLKEEFEKGKLMHESGIKIAKEEVANAKKNLNAQFRKSFPKLSIAVEELVDLNFEGTSALALAQENYQAKEREYCSAIEGKEKLSAFYLELNENINRDNMEERYDAMHKIIG